MKRPVLRSRRRGSGNDLRQNATCPDGAPVHPAPGIALGKWVMQGKPARRCAGGYTLIEILVATTLALMLMGALSIHSLALLGKLSAPRANAAHPSPKLIRKAG